MHRLPSIPRIPLGICSRRGSDSPRHCEFTAHSRHITGPSTPNVNHEGADIAVLGGGITGLASAYFLSRSLPNAKITLFEASSRLGGWLHSKQVDIASGSIVFEQGPRNLRPTAPNGLITLDLVCCKR